MTAITPRPWQDVHVDTRAAKQAIGEAAFVERMLAAVVNARGGEVFVSCETLGESAPRRVQIRADGDGGVTVRLAPENGSEGTPS